MKESFQKWLASRKVEARAAYNALMRYYPFALDDLPDEIWLPVPDYDKYQISNYGRVKSFRRAEPIILKPIFKYGYLYVNLWKDDKQKSFLIHRLVALCFIPNPEGKPQINHIDGHPLNNHVSNLEWVTQSENVQHAYATGLTPQGQDRPEAKLTNEQVRLIRENPEGLTTCALAEIFDVGQSIISEIQLGKSYRNAGGVIRKPIKARVSDGLRGEIKAEYQAGVRGYGCKVLAKKYGVDPTTILNIVREG